MKKILLYAQAVVLFSGTLFAWYTVYGDFARFYRIEGTFFKVTNCTIPNPVTTPCFYGAIVFLIAFTWSLLIVQAGIANAKKHQLRLWWLLLAGTLFAWGNFSRTLVIFYSPNPGPKLTCSSAPLVSPFQTPCFYGASLFLVSWLVASGIVWVYRRNQYSGPV